MFGALAHGLIAEEDSKLLKFQLEGNYFQFTCLPRIFTKVLKPVYAQIRLKGHLCMGHIDDSFLMGYDYSSCENNIHVEMFFKLGFIIHPIKSVLEPTQEFLGFLLNSISMTI
jgi:hypothetical protein